ncbi:MAG: NAD(P)H-dependent oxidoreductase [Methanohalobium sp.]|uniref:NAD(P)H-dependent oxidoreductase n=1 Tax=Methanohalobium sp. TaxID=2837493 RepID=UPI00397CDCE4
MSSGFKEKFSHIPAVTLDNLSEADAVIFGTPTCFGMMTAQMRTFLDAPCKLWANGDLIKSWEFFTSSATQNGGQDSTILSFSHEITASWHGYSRSSIF